MEKEQHFFRISRNQIDSPEDDGGITVEEWKAFLEADPSVEICEFIMARSAKDGTPIKIRLNVGAVWRDEENNPVAVFRFQNGSVVSSGTGETDRVKAQAIASVFEAVVIVEEYE
jgi:hypothetical protein